MRLWNNHSCHVPVRDITPSGSAEVGWSALMLVFRPAVGGHLLLILTCCHLLFICLTINASQSRNWVRVEEHKVQVRSERGKR